MGAVVAASLAARVFLAIDRPLWHDEVFTVWVSRLDIRQMIEVLRTDSGPPLFYLLEKPFVLAAEALHRSDKILRLLPLSASVLLIAGYRTLADRKSRLLFVLLCATSPLLLLYAAEARTYALLALLDFVLFFLGLRGRETWGRLVAAAAVTALTLFLHYIAILFVVAVALVAIPLRRWRSLVAIGVGTAAFLPWLPILLHQPKDAISWMQEPIGRSLVGFFSALGGSGRIPASLGTPVPGPFVAIGAVFAVFSLAGIVRPTRDVGAAAACVLLTLSGILMLSLFRPIAFPGRSEMAVLPIWIWAVASAAQTRRITRYGALATILLGTLSLVLLLVNSQRRNPTFVEALEATKEWARPGDVLFAGPGFYLPARLALDRGRLPLTLRAFPADIADHPGWFLPVAPSSRDYAAVEQRLDETRDGERTFLLLHPYYLTSALLQTLRARGQTLAILGRPDALLLLWTPEPLSHPQARPFAPEALRPEPERSRQPRAER
ncbi:MAG TPA: hypothetical protein VEO37_02425 [Thermoanaerobaculia bacterium]|nr:hypothetical protein [Thermoanaerobaculia bacterium]